MTNNPFIKIIADNIANSLLILKKFTYYEELDLNLIPEQLELNAQKGNDFTDVIKDSPTTTGIMISNTEVKKNNIFIFILDQTIFIINQTSLHKYQAYFKKNSNSIMFYSKECEANFNENISKEKDQKNSQKEKNSQSEENKIEKEIIKSIIQKSYIRTLNFHRQVLDSKVYNINNDCYESNDFIDIQKQTWYNFKDQIFNFLKFNKEDKNYNHEKEFYQAIDNSFPFICKVYGQTKDKNIVLEYIIGETLEKFITSHENIELKVKIKIICQILLAIFYSHSQGFFLRDLKPDNIMIDCRENNAFLIDFNYSKKTDSSDKKTSNFGSPYFVAPEINYSPEYSYKVDSYSIGLIIHFIITGKKFNPIEYESKEVKNISEMQEFPKCPKEYEYIFNIYKGCFASLPESRPDIIELIMDIFFNFSHIELNEIKINYVYPNLVKEFKKYEEKLKCDGSDRLIEKSYFEFMTGYIYYYCHYHIQIDVTKAINYLERSAKKNNSWANYALGCIYYEGKYIKQDISKAIEYFSLSSNQKNSLANYFIGEYYLDQHDIGNAIKYLKLSSNHPNAQFLLGRIYLDQGYIKNGLYYLKLSSDQNDLNALYVLGKMYYLGLNVPQDFKKAINYLELSSKENNPEANYLLGEIYYLGQNVKCDIDKAIDYFKKSSNCNNLKAKNFLGIIYKNNKKSINEAIGYFEEAKNYSYSLYNLARIYYFGIDIERDIQQSIDLLQASENFEFANIFLYYIYSYCDEFKIRNINKSSFYLEKISYCIQDILIGDEKVVEKLEKYLKQYDLFDCDVNLENFISFLLDGKFNDSKKMIQREKPNSLKKAINDDFYSGFYK